MDGFLNFNKPFGFTSHDCVAKLRRLLNQKRIGHAGTLDPAATGVLPIAIGKATRLLQFLPSDKAYRATIRLGLTTDTDDLAGSTLTSQPAPDLELTTVQQALQQFEGRIQQIPPNYSAIQVQGKRLYDLARSGVEITAQPRSVEVFKIEVLDWRPGEFPEVELAIACGAGTYIRSIARDLGRVLGTGGTLAALIRTHSSGCDLTNSLTLEMLETQLQQQVFQLTPPHLVLAHLEALHLPSEIAKRWCLGQRIAYEAPLTASEIVRIHDDNDRFLGIGEWSASQPGVILRPKLVYRPSTDEP